MGVKDTQASAVVNLVPSSRHRSPDSLSSKAVSARGSLPTAGAVGVSGQQVDG
jgi:hypothetical protein